VHIQQFFDKLEMLFIYKKIIFALQVAGAVSGPLSREEPSAAAGAARPPGSAAFQTKVRTSHTYLVQRRGTKSNYAFSQFCNGFFLKLKSASPLVAVSVFC
jgi:hypothetical protein